MMWVRTSELGGHSEFDSETEFHTCSGGFDTGGSS